MASTSKKSSGGNNNNGRSFLGLFPRKKKNQHDKHDNDDNHRTKQQPKTTDPTSTQEQKERQRLDELAMAAAERQSKRSLVALAYETAHRSTATTTASARGNPSKQQQRSVSRPLALQESASMQRQQQQQQQQQQQTTNSSSSNKTGWFSFLNPANSSFFKTICDDAFDSIDADGSGTIDDSELYRGLLLIHLKLGLYFGAPACKPISAENAKTVFRELDANGDGCLDKQEFRSVLALLMGNVLARIVFQFACTLVLVPLLAQTVLEGAAEAHGCISAWIVATLLPVWETHGPLLEYALGLDLVRAHLPVAWGKVADVMRSDALPLWLQVALATASETLETEVLVRVREIPLETWDSLPLTILSTVLALVIVPLSISKTDAFFQFLAQAFSGSGGKNKQ